MRRIVLFLILTLPLFAISNKYKVVIDSYQTYNEAQQAYSHAIANPKNSLFFYAHQKDLIVHARQAGNNYIIAIEPFSTHSDAQTILNAIVSFYPHAFISHGVADDIESLLLKHRKDFVTQQPKAVHVTQSISPPLKEITLPQSPPAYERWLLFALLIAFIGYSLWRERLLRQLKGDKQQLLNEKTQIQNAMHAKNEFIAMMNHEIRAPINAIMGINHLLLESNVTLNQRSQLTKIKDASTVLLTLVNDILDHSKIEAGKIILEEIPFDLNTLLDNVSNIISHKAKEKNLELIFDIDKSVPNKLIGDPLRLFQILVNLLNNALKFTDKGHVILRLRAEQITSLNLKIHFAIIDTGIGIKPEALQQLFIPYTQADATVTRKYGGTGLGLSICKNLIALMGGTIHVESTPNQGSTFSFEIHFYSDSAYEKRRYRLPTINLMSKNGLIVETNVLSADVLKRGLEYFHYEIKVVTHLTDALEILKNNFIDILFIDTTLVLSGEFKKELQNRIKNEGLKVVWLGDDLKKRGGIILTKPYNPLRVFNTILLAYGYLDQEKEVENNSLKFKEKLKQFSGKILLLAEDNDINRSIVKGLLTDTGITIIPVTNGKEAIEMVEQHPDINVILMDMQMPVMNGFEAAKWVRQDPKNDFISIIAITGNDYESTINTVSNSGINGYIGKPININTFYTTLYYAFEESRTKSSEDS